MELTNNLKTVRADYESQISALQEELDIAHSSQLNGEKYKAANDALSS